MRSLIAVALASCPLLLAACNVGDIEEEGMVNACERWYDNRQGIDGVDYHESDALPEDGISVGDYGTYSVRLKNAAGEVIGQCTVEAPENTDTYLVSAG